MPLVMITGYPSSGKTTRAEQLKAGFSSRNKTTIILNDEILGISKKDYDNASDEKKARATLMAAVERCLNKHDVVVVDALNYIKGYRYQLYCIARAIGTVHCVIHCCARPDMVQNWNEQRAEKYAAETIDNLIQRYEDPVALNRWEKPLFIVQADDAELPFEQIFQSLFATEAPPPNLSTVVKPVSDQVFSVDQSIQIVIKEILKSRKENPFLSEIRIAQCPTPIIIGSRSVSLHELKRHSNQFVKLHNQVSTSTTARDKLFHLFIDYLNSQWK